VDSEQEESLLHGLGDRGQSRGDSSPSRGVRAGTFKVTAYSNGLQETGKAPGDYGYGITKSGRKTVEGRTIATDWNVLPEGTVVYIKGVGYRTVDDIGGGINGREIDLYIDGSPYVLSEWGVKYLEVYVVGKEG